MDITLFIFAIDAAIVLVLGLVWIGLVAFLRIKKKKSLVYLLFFTIFYVYLYKVLDYTLFQFQFQIVEYFMPGRLLLNGYAAGENINPVPLVTLAPADLETSLLNILLLIPFGFGLPFITCLGMKKTILVGACFSILLEFLQLMSGLVTKVTFRVVDINDVIFNTLGVAIGYLLFLGFLRIYLELAHNRELSTNPILRYIAERPQIEKMAGDRPAPR